MKMRILLIFVAAAIAAVVGDVNVLDMTGMHDGSKF